MKYSLTFLLLAFLCIAVFSQLSSTVNPVQYLPDDVSFVLYINSLDRSYGEFKRTYFWKKYKLTARGKDLDRMLNSIDASFLVLGLTLDDMLEIFSQQAILGVWLASPNVIQDYLYLIEKKKGRREIDAIVERLEYFAIANKISLQKSQQNNFNIYNFGNKIYLAENQEFVLISNSQAILDKIRNRIFNKIIDNHNLMVFDKYFRNKNIVFYLKNLYYSFRFKNEPEIEVLYKDSTNIYTNQFQFDNNYFKMLPSDINYVYYAPWDLRDIIYPFFNLIGTNFYKLDKDYLNGYFSGIDFTINAEQIFAGKIDSKRTNIIRIIRVSSLSGVSNLFPSKVSVLTYLKQSIYTNQSQYYTFMNKKVVISDNLSYLKKSIRAYKNRQGFYFARSFKKIQAYQYKNFLVWIDFKKYLTENALKHGNEKWAYYNAYIKTFSHLMIYSDRKENYYYLKLFFY